MELSIYSPLVSSVLDTVEKSMFLRRNSESSRSDMVPRVPGVSTSSSIVMKELVATIWRQTHERWSKGHTLACGLNSQLFPQFVIAATRKGSFLANKFDNFCFSPSFSMVEMLRRKETGGCIHFFLSFPAPYFFNLMSTYTKYLPQLQNF